MTAFTANIILFGMPRHIPSFINSFEENILDALKVLGGAVRILGQLNLPPHIESLRSDESGTIANPETIIHRFPSLSLCPQENDQVTEELEFYKCYPDRWDDNYHSLSNLLHQQRSLQKGTRQALADPADIYIFLRPDLVYLDSMRPVFERVLSRRGSVIHTPGWLTCRGLNDRIAVTASAHSAGLYGSRMTFARRFVTEYNKGLHSERLLAYTLGVNRIPNCFFAQRAARCRISGNVVDENFVVKWRVKARTQTRLKLAPRSYAK